MAQTRSRYASYYGLRAPGSEIPESYETLILRHVQALDSNTAATREAVYSRVRSVMLKTLHDQQVGMERLITEKQKLEDAIERIERDQLAGKLVDLTAFESNQKSPPAPLNPLLISAFWVLGLSAAAAFFGKMYLDSHQAQTLFSVMGGRHDPAVDLATWSMILGAACFLIGIGLLIGGIYAQQLRQG